MNCPSRVDPIVPDGYNQNPNALNSDATTRADMNRVANARTRQDHRIDPADETTNEIELSEHHVEQEEMAGDKARRGKGSAHVEEKGFAVDTGSGGPSGALDGGERRGFAKRGIADGTCGRAGKKALAVLRKYAKFVGPGFMVAVAYIDPGNYATDVAAGASFRFKLLFIVLMSNIFAIFLQSLCIKLGSVTGMNLAENCKAHLPPWLNYILYFFAESAIIATDIAEVIGTAIALNILIKVPLVAGCAISIVDVLIILIFYRPSGSMRALRTFEIFVMFLVLGVVICFCFELSRIKAPVEDVFRGYLPSSTLIQSQALFQACGILGATVMPHSLYLGSGIVQPRLREFDDALIAAQHSTSQDLPPSTLARDTPDNTSLHSSSSSDTEKYRPSLAAIQACMSYSIAELAISLFTFALFVNSAILIVAGASLHDHPDATSADLFSIHALLASSIAPIAGTLFALALLLSGTSAGIVCTIAGQIVSEGQLNWRMKPWLRRLVTRAVSITPSIIIAGAVGREGLGKALEGSQVALSVILPVVSAPLIWFTCRAQYMQVEVRDVGVEGEVSRSVNMRNHWITAAFAVVVWGVVVVMNGALLVLVGMGVA